MSRSIRLFAILGVLATSPGTAADLPPRLAVLMRMDATSAEALRVAAEGGDAEAMALLGEARGLGFGGMPPDAVAATAWLRRAAATGKAGAAAEADFFDPARRANPIVARLQSALERGEAALSADQPPPANAPDADLVDAAEAGLVDAQILLARQYEAGRGAPRDDAMAALWYGRAADGGSAEGHHAMAGVLMRGGDARGARRHLEEAAAMGHAAAQAALAALCLGGIGGAADPSEAVKWLVLAERAGDAKAATARPRVEDAAGAGATADGRQRAAAWRPASR